MASVKFKYVGDPNDRFSGPEVVEGYHGLPFVKGEVTEIDDTEENADVIRRLRGNSHFVDMSDKETVQAVSDQQKALEKAEADKAKAEDEQRKRDEADEKQRQKNLAAGVRNRSRPTAAEAPRPPGTQTPPPVLEPFGGRTVEQRTRAEDHTSAGKTKS